MTIHEVVALTVLVCQGEAVLWYVGGRWNGRKAIERAKDEGWDACEEDYARDRSGVAWETASMEVRDLWPEDQAEPSGMDDAGGGYGPGASVVRGSGPEDSDSFMGAPVIGHTIYPELAALAAQDVPEPEPAKLDQAYEAVLPAELGHPSPYTGNLTPAQRRRDKHKQRGPYAPCDLPDPPTDVGAWWQAELDALLEQGQSDWLTRNLETVAA